MYFEYWDTLYNFTNARVQPTTSFHIDNWYNLQLKNGSLSIIQIHFKLLKKKSLEIWIIANLFQFPVDFPI